MSATNRGGKRSPADFYPTPDWATRLFMSARALPRPGTGRWLEPSAGDGAIVRAVNAHYDEEQIQRPDWHVVELAESRRESLQRLVDPNQVVITDFRNWAEDQRHAIMPCGPRPFAVGIGNPPFSLAERFLVEMLALCDYVALLLRSGFTHTEERYPLWEKYGAPDKYEHPQRLSFNGRGSDSSDYAWFVFGPDRPRATGKLRILPLVGGTARAVPRLPGEVPAQVELL